MYVGKNILDRGVSIKKSLDRMNLAYLCNNRKISADAVTESGAEMRLQTLGFIPSAMVSDGSGMMRKATYTVRILKASYWLWDREETI